MSDCVVAETSVVNGENQNWADDETLSIDGYELESGECSLSCEKMDEDSVMQTEPSFDTLQPVQREANNYLHRNDVKRLLKLRTAAPFFLTTRYFVYDDEIAFVSAGIRDDLALRELRGKLYYSRSTVRRRGDVRAEEDIGFISTDNVSKSFIHRLNIPKKILDLIDNDLNINPKYEREGYRVDPLEIVSFIFKRCTENSSRNRQPLIVTWQSFQDMMFLRNHIMLDKRIPRCDYSNSSCNYVADDARGKYFTLDFGSTPVIICDSKFHNVNIDGLVNPIWINMCTRKISEDGTFCIDFKYENKITIFSAVLGVSDTHKRLLNIQEAHSLTGCCETHENAANIAGTLSYAKCIFSKFRNDLYEHVNNVYEKRLK